MYLIPRNVSAKFEFFPGFGWFELASVVAGALLGLGLFFLSGLLTKSVIRFVFFVLPPGLAFFVTKQGLNGQSLLDLIRQWRRWSMAQRRYLYVARGE
ncbi:predicted transcriptional regulators [Moorella thermoacetica Y72]|uniref:PrgI family protein n=2 Tax=Neomoorella thermoacetica TaxID=1525 RepID=A0A1J5JE79_NEOTH|nr:PrgI family protein [Moorella thermoacetica]OIQ07834.1 hypothetical protein MOOR_25600 [Moorella thermoacetica]GAF27409.1 predicted transcriptional regulators [Moorella thermoacetica Y72]